MAIDKNNIIKRINDLMELAKEKGKTFFGEGEITSGTISILETVYGSESQTCKAYIEKYQSYARNKMSSLRIAGLVASSIGTLRSIKAEIESGLIGSITTQAQGGIIGDFITAARQALEENNKDVAAVLACAALEDALKRYAEQKGLAVSDADMSQVINALKSQGLLKDPQASIVQSYVKLRNKAFHAEWDKIEKESVGAAIGFTEQFILSNFG
jgi:hypothetical protein